MVATMHLIRIAAMLVLSSRFLFLTAHAQQQEQPLLAVPPSCLPHERDALLAFKHGVTSDPAGILSSWRRDGGNSVQDCCRWRGVRCSNRTGHVHELRLGGTLPFPTDYLVGQISPSLLALDHLEHLDLSGNDLAAGPSGGRLPEFLGSLKSLTYLNLSSIPFYGGLPPQLGNLSKLHYLDLSHTGGTNSTDLSWLTRLPSIQYLNLNGVNLLTVEDWSHVMNMLPSLRVLRLSGCSLVSANQSLQHINLTNLDELDASWNFFHHPMASSWFWNITNLKYLYLQEIGMYGRFPDALGGMISLQVLDLSFADYDGDDDEKHHIMTANLKNLCNLVVLNFHYSALHGDVTELFRNLPRCSPNKLQDLDLGANELTGTLPSWIGQFASLRTLDLFWNNVSGNVPYEIGKLSNLTYLDLNGNNLDGFITEEHFVSARSLQYIDFSYNSLMIQISSYWQPPFRLHVANFAACKMGPLFPGWLQRSVNITRLDISSAGISSRLPQWFSVVFSNVEFMNISNNQLSGSLPTIMGFMSLQELYLNSNQLTGQIPTLPPNISILDLSNNFLSGPLPSATRSAKLQRLSLFSNQITGHISESYCKYQGLIILDLANNFLEGELPLCLGVMAMQFLGLSNNSLSGGFPSFIQNLPYIVFIDLAINKFSGKLPMWIGEFPRLRVLRVSHNKFSGNIPVSITNLACLQYMDLNNNEISRSLPSNMSNLKAMGYPDTLDDCSLRAFVPDVGDSDIYNGQALLHSWSMILKGQELNYGSIFRVLDNNMVSIDLSSNNLTGIIPEEIVVLDTLVNLNLSRNRLSGVIPHKIGEMHSLQSLDLSRDMLSGEIPATLSNLTFLSYLDLSYNDLTGRIPSGVQLDSLYSSHPSMYIGNTGLCGHPLPNNCSSEGHAPNQSDLGRTKEGYGIPFFYLGLGCGFVVGTWMAFGVLLFKRSWRISCFRLTDKLCDKVYVLVVLWARQRRTDDDA